MRVSNGTPRVSDDGDNCILYWPEGLRNPSMGGGWLWLAIYIRTIRTQVVLIPSTNP